MNGLKNENMLLFSRGSCGREAKTEIGGAGGHNFDNDDNSKTDDEERGWKRRTVVGKQKIEE